jgi:hypothetical protein
MFKDLLDFSGYGVMAWASTLLFLAIFLAVVIRVLFLKPGYTEKMRGLPLESTGADAMPREEQRR